jgi:protein-tyrosine phosphatase
MLSISSKSSKEKKIRESYIVLEGATGFFSRYPYVANHMQSDAIVTLVQAPTFSSFECDLPHDILDARLFLGSFSQSERYDLVRELKITHILNMTTECDNMHEDKGIKYMKVSILDEDDKNIHDHFQAAYQFIHDALTEDVNNNVLVHCAMGKSRSATIIIMYLMKKFSWGFEKAFAFVKRKRDMICPNYGFVQRLQEFEKNQLAFVGSL